MRSSVHSETPGGEGSVLALFFCCLLVAQVPLGAAEAKEKDRPKTPELLSIFPTAAQQGSSVEVELQGRVLEGTHAVWFSTPLLTGKVETVEEIKLKVTPEDEAEVKKGLRGHRVVVKVNVDPAAPPGRHSLRLVSPKGVSNQFSFFVHTGPVVLETRNPHSTPPEAQPLTLPAVLTGRISQEGELDYYSFEVDEGQELRFVAVMRSGGDDLAAGRQFGPQLTLEEPGSSWFEANRGRRLAVVYPPIALEPVSVLRYRFPKSGRYLLAVSSFLNIYRPQYSYQLMAGPGDAPPVLPEESFAVDVFKRSFERKLEPSRLQLLLSRTVPTQQAAKAGAESSSFGAQTTGPNGPKAQSTDPASASDTAVRAAEQEPNDAPSQALEVRLPVLVEGVIDRPGDVDSFKIHVAGAQKLAFEIETPDAPPPVFNPKIRVLDANGERELVTNVYRWIAGDGDDWIKRIEPKTIYAFGSDEEYLLQVRDLTARNGDSSFRYRILIRAQIPHMGKIEVKESRINLARGQAAKLTVITEQEEGYSGDISLEVENLPPGVRVSTATQVEEETPPPLNDGEKELYLPKSQEAIILLAASADAPLTRLPQVLRVMARPVVEGKIGAPSLVREVPLMVLKPVLKPDATEGDAPEGSEKEGSKKEP